MDQKIAKKIAELLNLRNQLPNKIEWNQVMEGNYFYIAVKGAGEVEDVVACGRAKSLNFYSYEIKHISVSQQFEGKGFGRYIIEIIEDYIRKKNIPMVTATTRAANFAIISLFTKLGYTRSHEFINEGTKNPLILWQKFLKNEPELLKV